MLFEILPLPLPIRIPEGLEVQGILKDNGLYCGVLKEGVFFDGKFKDLRKNLVENYNVQYVISIPQSDFWNTSTKTSILIFKNDKQRTKEINFCELKELIEDGDNIGVQEINPETKKIIREFISSNYEWNKKTFETRIYLSNKKKKKY